jgi:integrase/recombinase XerD
MNAIYTREKLLKDGTGKPFPDGKPHWRYQRVNVGRGRRPAGLQGPFYSRIKKADSKWQSWVSLGDTLDEAVEAAEKLGDAMEAQAKGLTIAELDGITDANRTPIKRAVADFLEQKSSKAKRTIDGYRLHLEKLVEFLPPKIRFVDEISGEVLRAYKKHMTAEGLSERTVGNRLLTVFILLKRHGIKNPLGWDEMPTVEDEIAVAYTPEELKTLFAAMTDEENSRYKFFLGTACRDKEVTYAAWQDVDFSKGTFHVRAKKDVGFTPKSHESRIIPLPTSLVAMLKERRKKAADPRWIFVNEEGRPDNHFLRKLKRIAHRAGLNCGQCKTTVNKGRYERKRPVEVTCKTDPVCEHWYLHRLRKTCATRWQENGIPVRTIQAWLGHKNLETTMLYLGVTDTDKLRGQIDKSYGD